MLVAISVDLGEQVGVRRLGPKRFRGQDRSWRVVVDGRRDHDDTDIGPSRRRAKGAQEIPAVHDGHAKVEQDETWKLNPGLEQVEGFLPVASFVERVSLAAYELGDDAPSVCMIIHHQDAAHGWNTPDFPPYPFGSRRTHPSQVGIAWPPLTYRTKV